MTCLKISGSKLKHFLANIHVVVSTNIKLHSVKILTSKCNTLQPSTDEDHPNANIGDNEHYLYKLYNLFRNRCKLNKV